MAKTSETELFVSRIQRFSTADGPGIRTTVFLGGCNLRCLWCHNPETQEARVYTMRYANGTTEVCGSVMTVDEVFAEVMRDEAFYTTSGGGVTVSGGEPLLQFGAVAALLKKLKEAGVHTLVDTAADLPFSYFEAVLPYTDLFFYDVKAGNTEKYAKYTGGNFARVAENLARLTAAGKKAIVRIPVVWGVNTDAKSVKSIANVCKRAGVEEIDLLPYHKYGIAKYEAIKKPYLLTKKRKTPQKVLENIATTYENAGFAVKIEK